MGNRQWAMGNRQWAIGNSELSIVNFKLLTKDKQMSVLQFKTTSKPPPCQGGGRGRSITNFTFKIFYYFPD